MDDSAKTGELNIKAPGSAEPGASAPASGQIAAPEKAAVATAAVSPEEPARKTEQQTALATTPEPSQHQKDKDAAIDALFADDEEQVSFIPVGPAADTKKASADNSASTDGAASEVTEEASAEGAQDAIETEGAQDDVVATTVGAEEEPASKTEESETENEGEVEKTSSGRPSVKNKAKVQAASLKEKLAKVKDNANSANTDASKQRKKIELTPAKIALIVGAVLLAAVLAVVIWFASDRWWLHNDAEDIQGIWYANGTQNTVTINGETIQLTSDIAYSYTLDTGAKTISFTFGRDYSGEGRYRFSPDRQQLVITDGADYDFWSTLGEDIAWRWGLLVDSITGKQSEEPAAGDGVTVLDFASELPAEAATPAEDETADAAAQTETPSDSAVTDDATEETNTNSANQGTVADDTAADYYDDSYYDDSYSDDDYDSSGYDPYNSYDQDSSYGGYYDNGNSYGGSDYSSGGYNNYDSYDNYDGSYGDMNYSDDQGSSDSYGYGNYGGGYSY